MKKNKIYLLLLLIAFLSCTKETAPPVPPVIPEGETQVSITLQIPDMSTRSGEMEKAVQSLSILVFGQSSESSPYELFYKATATAGNGDGSYTANLRATDSPAQLFLIANVSDLSAIQTGDTPEEASKKLVTPFTEEGFISLPMSTIIDQELPSGEAIEIKDVELVRSVAGIRVYLDQAVTNFTLKSIQVYRANSYIQVVPDPALLTGNKVSAASVPVRSAHVITSERIEIPTTEEGNLKELDGLYVPESNPVSASQVQATATCLILGGYYEDSLTETFYRVDFKNETENTTGQLLRNYRYNIKVTNVSGPGTTHPGDGNTNSITVTMDGWSDSGLPPVEL